MKIEKKYFLIFTSAFILLMILTIIGTMVLLPDGEYDEGRSDQEYQKVIGLFDNQGCWSTICPGKTDVRDVKEQIANGLIVWNDINYQGDDINGGITWLILPSQAMTKSFITWQEEIVNKIKISVIYSDTDVEYFISLYGEPEYLVPRLHTQTDTPDYWTVRLYYPEKGIEIIAQNRSGTNLFQRDDWVFTIVLFKPSSIDVILEEEFQEYSNKYKKALRKWHGYGNLEEY